MITAQGRSMTTRTVYWGHWSLDLLEDGSTVHKVNFPIGLQGPIDGTLGSPLRQNFECIAVAWVAHGETP